MRRENEMKAMVIVSDADGGTLEYLDVPNPEPAAEELLVRVKATSLNRADLAQRQGNYPAPSRGSDTEWVVAGLEAAGEVIGMGDSVTGFASGDRVMAMCGGSYSEFVTVDYRLAMPVPEQLSWAEAATIPVAYMTEHDALSTHARLQSGESVLVHAASSGVGIAAIQLAKLLGAAPVLGTGGDPAKLAALAALGLDEGIDYHEVSFADAVLAATDNNGVDVVVDHVGASHFQDNLRCMALRGRLIGVGRLGGRHAELDLDLLALKRLELIGVTFRTRTLEERIEIAQRCAADLLPALSAGRIQIFIDRTFSLDEAMEAQGYMASNAHIGKIVLMVGE